MQTRHFAQLIALSALWGASFPFIRIASPALGPWGVAGLRCVLAALVLSVLMRVLRNHWPARGAWPLLLMLSLLTVVAPFVLFSWAGLILPAGYSAVLNATVPLFGVLAAALAGEERLTARRLLGCLVGFAGVALLVQLGPVAVSREVLLAALACIAASACYGCGAILMKRATMAHQPLPASAAVHVAAALVLLLPAAASAPAMRPTSGALLAVATLGIVTSGFMYWISMRLMREIPASAATSSAFMIPLFGVTWGSLFLDEPVTSGMLPGCVLVLAATALVTGFNPFRSVPPEP
ncbi:DMT family transporter [Variovorax terrae]|uniref:DMT family transporter n=1 Tax=Variovorax terrae TaxID=2923278 RepID=A0A9X2ANN7_9BURK|nr:DMT family transporter [Variovorax terrae]MCJ0763955.1 DMT family transporter [Variovorax terrae]